MTEQNTGGISPVDWGPIYRETVYGRWPVEPWNTVTTLLFLALVVYWSFRIMEDPRRHRLLSICVPVIGVGFVGGFLYHSFRNHPAWLILDWGPIVVTAIICTVFLWHSLVGGWLKACLFTAIPLTVFMVLHHFVGDVQSLHMLNYVMLVVTLCIPLAIKFVRDNYRGQGPLGLAFLFIIMALTSRALDKNAVLDFLPMGSHFLWHICGALTCHFLILYFYRNPLIDRVSVR